MRGANIEGADRVKNIFSEGGSLQAGQPGIFKITQTERSKTNRMVQNHINNCGHVL